MSTLSLATAFAEALDWFAASLSAEEAGCPDLGPALEAMIAAAICSDLVPELAPRARSIVKAARTQVSAAFGRPDGSVEAGPPKRLLLSGVAGNALGYQEVPELAAYRDKVIDALSELTAAGADRELAWARLLLTPFGEGEVVVLPLPLPERLECAILRGPQNLQDHLAAIETATCFGCAPAETADAPGRALEAALLCTLREYDLASACRVMRALAYLRPDSPVIALASRFLLLQQTEEGAFGCLDLEIEALAQAPQGAARQLRSAINLECIWALAEASDSSYRMFRDLGRRQIEIRSDRNECVFRRKTATVPELIRPGFRARGWAPADPP